MLYPQGGPPAVHLMPLLLVKSGNRGLLTPPTDAPEMESSEKEKIRLIRTPQEANYGNTYNLGREKYRSPQIGAPSIELRKTGQSSSWN